MTVALAYVHDLEVSHSFQRSMQNLVLYDLDNEQHLFGASNPISIYCRGYSLPGARNKVAQRILDSPEYDWLCWIDTDMGFLPDTVSKLVAVADPVERPIVGGLCFVQRATDDDEYGGYVTSAGPTIMDWVPEQKQFAARAWYPPNELVQCATTGSACILIHRSVIEKIHAEYGPAWYDQTRGVDGLLVSEDIAFCMRAATVNAPVHIHTGIRTTHMKSLWLGEREFWDQAIAPPALEQTAVLVPVLGRPQNAEPFMRSLRASTGLADVYAVCGKDDTDTWQAWETAGANMIVASGKRFATKINDGYRFTGEPWLFITGDDVRFHPGWLDHAQYAAGISGANVIGTNDLGNPRIMRGEHAAHLLIRRDYINEHGASWDGPCVVCHEGYRHWYVDDEIVTAAKQRSTWAMALASKVEHLHPYWGKAPTDDTYKLGEHAQESDMRLYKKRLEANNLGRAHHHQDA